MKKYVPIILAALFAIAPTASFADSEGTPDNNWNISTNPLGLIVGPNLRLDYKVAPQWTLGLNGSLIYINVGGVKANGTSIGIDAAYNFNQAFVHSWFIGGGVHYSVVKAKYTEDNGTEDNADVVNVSVPLIGGYHWFWGNFNLQLGLGPTLNFPSKKQITDKNGKDVKEVPLYAVGVAGDASIGWTF